MKKVRVAKIFLSGLLAMSCSFPVVASDYLAPCGEPPPGEPVHIRSLTAAEIPGEVEFWTTVYPSLMAPWSIGVSRKAQEFDLVLVVMKKSSWIKLGSQPQSQGHPSWDEVRSDPVARRAATRMFKTRISPALHQLLYAEWSRSTQQVYPVVDNILDGVGYEFRLADGACGSTHSPTPESRAGKLVGLIAALRKLATQQVHRVSLIDEAPVMEILHAMPPPGRYSP